MIGLYITMLLVFITYVSYIWYKYGIQKSISASYYSLPDKHKWIFTMFCWGFAIPAILLGQSLLMFVAAGLIVLVGASPAFKDELEHKVHLSGAVIGIIISQISAIFEFNMWYVPCIVAGLTGAILLTKSTAKTWWIEIVAFLSICYVLGVNL